MKNVCVILLPVLYNLTCSTWHILLKPEFHLPQRRADKGDDENGRVERNLIKMSLRGLSVDITTLPKLYYILYLLLKEREKGSQVD